MKILTIIAILIGLSITATAQNIGDTLVIGYPSTDEGYVYVKETFKSGMKSMKGISSKKTTEVSGSIGIISKITHKNGLTEVKTAKHGYSIAFSISDFGNAIDSEEIKFIAPPHTDVAQMKIKEEQIKYEYGLITEDELNKRKTKHLSKSQNK